MAMLLAVVGLGAAALTAGPAGADSQTTSNAPYTCTTNPNAGNQAATYGVTASDTVDPATPGQAETYRFVVPFSQAKPPVTATYQGGSTSYRIPAGFTVTSVSTQAPAGGSPISSTAAVQGNSVVVTSTANVALDGTSYPTPDLLVNGTIQASAAGAGVKWAVPYQLVAVVAIQGFGNITATCTPDSPTTIIASTTVPAGPAAPVAKNQNVALPAGTSKAITLTATDADTPQNQLVFAIATAPAHGTLTGTAPTVTYAPTAGYTGADSFTFTVTDPQGGHSTGTVTINVFPSTVVDNTPPTITITSPTNGAVYAPAQVVDAAFTCADATTGIKSCAGTVATGAAISTTVGVHTFTVNASDNANNLAQSTVSYRVVGTALVTSAVTALPIDCGTLQPLAPKSIPVSVSAPAQVGTGRTLKFHVALGSQSVAALTTATNLRYVFNPIQNGTVTSAAIESGTGTANARTGATVTNTSGTVTLTLPGPITGGTTAATAFTPPVFDVTITAGTTVGATIVTTFQRFEEHTAVTLATQDLNCAAGNAGQSQPNPNLTSTTIIDTTPPTALISKPGNGDVILSGTAVTAGFLCADDHSLASCTGTAANGAVVSTATTGIKTFTVHATDAAGNVAQKLVSYTVVPATVTFTADFPAADAANLDAVAAYFGTTRANLPGYGVAILAYIDSVNPTAAQPVVPPPANTGPLALPTTYPYATAAAVTTLAGKYGMDGNQLHVFAVEILAYVYAVRTGQ
jgi:hypothetical protein